MLIQDQLCGCSNEWACLHFRNNKIVCQGLKCECKTISFIVHVDVEISRNDNFIRDLTRVNKKSENSGINSF